MMCDNITAIIGKIKQAAQKAGRDPGQITLVCVTKNRSLEIIKEAIGCGISNIGENKVQEAALKYKSIGPKTEDQRPVAWHLIGHLQTNKARDAVRIFDLIHSVDSMKLAKEIDAQAAKIKKVQNILIEVNTSGEETKFGIKSGELLNLVKEVIDLPNIKLLGLMTMAPMISDKEQARPYFRKLRQLQEEANNFLRNTQYAILNTLSMGMTQDYETAIEEGATMVRIGTAIFEG